MKLEPTALPGVAILQPRVFRDDRGWFMESFNEAAFAKALAGAGLPPAPPFVQDNHSMSRQWTLRGLHYQLPPRAQGKLVRVVAGRAWDVAVDIRRGSPAFGRWVGVELDAAGARQLWIPPGFAHGFLALEPGTEFLYKTTDFYDPASERAIAWNDAALSIGWPLPAGVRPLVNGKDAEAPGIAAADVFA